MTSISRRDWLRGGLALAAAGAGARRLAAAENPGGRALLVSTTGGDRATGYVMSNKIVRRGNQLLCAWLDVDRQNQWALVDIRQRRILRSGPVGPPRSDNHCGTAVATDIDGTWHLLVGAHHGSFIHFRWPSHGDGWQPVENGQAVGHEGTYPSLVCDRYGTLHVTYRRENHGTDAHLMYCRRPAGGKWSAPRALVRSAVNEHSWLTNAIEAGPSGRLHAVVSNTLPVPAQGSTARYFGASHLTSDDGGESWRQFGAAAPLALPADAATLARIEGSTLAPERIEREYGGPRGPLHSYYHKMVLSNPAVDDGEHPWAIVHNIQTGDTQLFRHEAAGRWIGTSLAPAVKAVLPGHHIRHCGQLSRCRDGALEVVLMTSPPRGTGWGDRDTALVRLRTDPTGRIIRQELVRASEPGMPHWLPSLERWCAHSPVERPALLYTRGLNAGGYDHNVNRVQTEVWLDLG